MCIFCISANLCTPISVPNSDKSADGSITGNTYDAVSVTCDAGYTGSGDVICQADGTFTDLNCTGKTHTSININANINISINISYSYKYKYIVCVFFEFQQIRVRQYQ